MSDNHSEGRINGHRVFNDVHYANLGRFDNDMEQIVVRCLLALEATTGSNEKLLHIVFGILLVIILLLV